MSKPAAGATRVPPPRTRSFARAFPQWWDVILGSSDSLRPSAEISVPISVPGPQLCPLSPSCRCLRPPAPPEHHPSTLLGCRGAPSPALPAVIASASGCGALRAASAVPRAQHREMPAPRTASPRPRRDKDRAGSESVGPTVPESSPPFPGQAGFVPATPSKQRLGETQTANELSRSD